MSDLQALLARVEAAEQADSNLDRDIAVALYQPREFRPECRPARSAAGCVTITYVSASGRRTYGTSLAEPVTASLDAALALVERALAPNLLEVTGGWNPADPAEWPAWTIRWYQPPAPIDGKSWWAQVATARTPALALLAALLKALIAQAEAA